MLFWEIAGKHNMVIFDIKCIIVIEKNQISEANNDFIIRYRPIILEIIFLLAEGFQGVFTQILRLNISGQAQYLVTLEVSLLAPRISNVISYIIRIIHIIYFVWQV